MITSQNLLFPKRSEEDLEKILLQWEPKVHAILISFGIKQSESDYEDAAQNLRIKIVQAARKYDPERGEASFHTYLHVAMKNAAQDFLYIRKKKWGYGQSVSLDAILSPEADNNNPSAGVAGVVFRRFGYEDEYFPCPIFLTGAEAVLYNLLMMEMTYKEIHEVCSGDVKKTLVSLRRKVKAYMESEMDGHTTGTTAAANKKTKRLSEV